MRNRSTFHSIEMLAASVTDHRTLTFDDKILYKKRTDLFVAL